MNRDEVVASLLLMGFFQNDLSSNWFKHAATSPVASIHVTVVGDIQLGPEFHRILLDPAYLYPQPPIPNRTVTFACFAEMWEKYMEKINEQA